MIVRTVTPPTTRWIATNTNSNDALRTASLTHLVPTVWERSGNAPTTTMLCLRSFAPFPSSVSSSSFPSFPYFWSCWLELSSVILDKQSFDATISSIPSRCLLKFFFQLHTTNRLLTVSLALPSPLVLRRALSLRDAPLALPRQFLPATPVLRVSLQPRRSSSIVLLMQSSRERSSCYRRRTSPFLTLPPTPISSSLSPATLSMRSATRTVFSRSSTG